MLNIPCVIQIVWLGGAVVRALDLRLGGPSRCTVECNFGQLVHTHIVQRLWCYNLMALYKSVKLKKLARVNGKNS